MPSSPKITITIKLFAAYQEAYNVGELKRDFSPNTSILEVLNQLISERPELEKWRSLTRFGLNLQFVEAETLLQDGDEIVFIPPVSGG
ncbi:MAG: molybdopterin synthase sulfur carrier subunit [Snowella sp.]|jgi:molybdopterin synthase sulfur carrier subunit|nr:MAG: molybdopterin synthase sulfur carrier subunit [Snowella sp.]